MRPDPPQDAPLRGLIIMIVEDEFLIAMNLEALLETYGARILGPAATVTEALHLLETESPDVALLDVHLRDGLVTPVAEALRTRSIPYVLASAYSASDFASHEALANVPNIGKLTREQDLISALTQASKS
jgi:DNA-binding NarL/FixJ family response regulator